MTGKGKQLVDQISSHFGFVSELEEQLIGRKAIVLTDFDEIADGIVPPSSLNLVKNELTSAVVSDWTDETALYNAILPSVSEVVSFWERIHRRHETARTVFLDAECTPYCLYLRSFSLVSKHWENDAGRLTVYRNDASLDANFASAILSQAGWLNPICCLHTDDLALLTGDEHLPAFRVQTKDWKVVLREAIARSGMIIFYIDEASRGIEFEMECIAESGLNGSTVAVLKHPKLRTPEINLAFAAVFTLTEFLEGDLTRIGPGTLRPEAIRRLKAIRFRPVTATADSLLATLQCCIVDPTKDLPDDRTAPTDAYFVTSINRDAFALYLDQFPAALSSWTEMMRSIRISGNFPSIEEFQVVFGSIKSAFLSAASLGLTSSMAITLALITRASSLVKHPDTNFDLRRRYYEQLFDLAKRLDTLTKSKRWGDQIEKFRALVRADPNHS